MKSMDLISLQDYEAVAPLIKPPDASGIECPECKAELVWAEKSLVCRDPPMRRLVCPECDFSKVVVHRE